MTDRSSHDRLNSAPGKAPEFKTIVERFRRYDAQSCAQLHFEQSSDLGLALEAIGETAANSLEAQVLVRLNVDDQNMSIITVDGAVGPSDDVAVLKLTIATLTDTLQTLESLT